MWIKDEEKRLKYYKITSSREPSPLLLKALKFGKFNSALDLGCGAGVDAVEMARQGLFVTALDVNPEVKDYFKNTPDVDVKISSFKDFNYGKYDFIFSKSALVFVPPEDFESVIKKIKKALNTSGVFAARFWGENDSSAKKPERQGKMTFVTKEKLEEMFDDFEILEINEIEKDEKTALGQPKHWHFVDLIVRRSD